MLTKHPWANLLPAALMYLGVKILFHTSKACFTMYPDKGLSNIEILLMAPVLPCHLLSHVTVLAMPLINCIKNGLY